MAHVIDIGPVPDEPEAPAVARIRIGSRALEWLFAGLFALGVVLVGGAIVAIAAYPGDRVQICSHSAWIGLAADHAPLGCRPFADLPTAQRLAYVVVALLHSAPGLMILWNLRALFRLYARGVIFAFDNTARLKAIGAWLVAAAFGPLIGHLFLSLTSLEIDKAWLHLAAVQEVILGALVLVIAQVMQVGHALEDEQRQIV